MGLSAAISFIELPDYENAILITDLFKRRENFKNIFITLKLVTYYLKSNKLLEKSFCLIFVEEQFKSLQPIIDYAIKKHKFTSNEELIYSYVFLIDLNESANTNEKMVLIDNVNCRFYTDKGLRHFIAKGKNYYRAYVEADKDIDSDETCLKIIKEGKNFSKQSGCNVFIFLTNSKKDLGQTYYEVNRKIELRHEYIGKKINSCRKGILI